MDIQLEENKRQNILAKRHDELSAKGWMKLSKEELDELVEITAKLSEFPI